MERSRETERDRHTEGQSSRLKGPHLLQSKARSSPSVPPAQDLARGQQASR